MDYLWFVWRPSIWGLVAAVIVLLLLLAPLLVFRHYRLGYLAILSTFTLFFISVLCIRSYYASDSLHIGWHYTRTATWIPTNHINMITGDGGLYINFDSSPTIDPKIINNPKLDLRAQIHGYTFYQSHPYPLPNHQSILGFKYQAEDNPQSPRGWTDIWFRRVVIPFWAFYLLFAIFPALWLRRFFRNWSRRKRGLCLKCAYDLHGNTSGKCPECGTPVPKRKEIKAIDTAKPAA